MTRLTWSLLRWPVAVLAVVLVLGSGGYAVARARDSAPTYSTAEAVRADVERTLDLSGSVTATGRRDLGFGTSGTLSSVRVRSGETVRAGQVLARLDPTALQASVTSAVATLAKATAQLATDEDAQTSTVTSAASATTASAAAPTGSTGGAGGTSGTSGKKPASSGAGGDASSSSTDPALQHALAALKTQQRAVTAAQTATGKALTTASSALATQTATCRNAVDDGSQDSDEDGSDDSSGAGTSDGTGDGSSGGDAAGSGVSADCTQALAEVQDAQATVQTEQDLLQAALTALGTTLGQAVAAVQQAGQTTGQDSPSTGQADAGTPSSGAASTTTPSASGASSASGGSGSSGASDSSGGAGGSGSTARTVTAATLAKDQADIDTAQAEVTQARAERGLAVLRAPYAGRVLQVDLAQGDRVAATDAAVVLVGAGVTTVTTTVTAAQVSSVRRGQSVLVTPAGWTTALSGTVTLIGLLPDDSSSYPVTVTVASGRTVPEGTTASLAVTTGAAKQAVSVPTSAVTRAGARATVQVLSGQKVTRTAVTLGVGGTRRVAVTDGLEVGQTVVLADLAASLPSSDAQQGTGRGGFGGQSGGPQGGGIGGGPPTGGGGR